MTDDPLAPFRTPGTSAPRPADDAESQKHRSVADGNLTDPWTLTDFFRSLNSVMRLPTRARRKQTDEGTAAGGFSLQNLRLPRWVMVGGFAAAVVVLVGRPLVAFAFQEEAGADLTRVLGIWKATEGRYAGRLFEVTPETLTFHTGAASSEKTIHRITRARVQEAGDSTLFLVSYDQEGKTAEFSFYLVPRPKPVIHFKNQQGVTWAKTSQAAKPAQRS